MDLMKFDIGIMPLTNDEWGRGKSGNKAIYYMGLGLPAVVSPVGVNVDLVTHGETGMLASSLSDWVGSIRELILKPKLRYTIGRKARQRVLEGYSQKIAAEKLSGSIFDAIGRNQ